MTVESLGRDWGLTPEQGAEAFGLLVTSFARCLPRLGQRSQVAPMLANLIERSPLWTQFSVEQRSHVWERCKIMLDFAYSEFANSLET